MVSVTSASLIQRSLAWMVASCLCFALVMVSIRLFLVDLPTEQSVFLRYAIGSVFLLPFIGMTGLKFWKWPQKWRFLIRGVLHGLGVVTWFFALLMVPLAEINALLNLGPVYATLGAVLVFGERLKLRRIMAIVISFVGALIVIKPGFADFNLGIVAILLTAPLFAASDLIAKGLKAVCPDNLIIFGLSSCIAVLLAGPAMMAWAPMRAEHYIGVLAIASFATLGHVTLMRAFRGPMWAAQMGKYVQLLFVVIFGIALFDEIPVASTLIGAMVVLLSVSYIAWREHQLAKQGEAQ